MLKPCDRISSNPEAGLTQIIPRVTQFFQWPVSAMSMVTAKPNPLPTQKTKANETLLRLRKRTAASEI